MRFDNMSPGDIVAVYGHGSLEKRRAERVTATMFVLNDGRKFSRRSGKQHGSSSWSSVWSEPWTSEHDRDLAERKKDQELRDLRRRLRAIDWNFLDEAQVRQVVGALEAAGVLSAA